MPNILPPLHVTMPIVPALKPIYFWFSLLLCLQFIAVFAKAETQQHNRRQRQPYIVADRADDASNEVNPHQRSSYRRGDARHSQLNVEDENYHYNKRLLTTSDTQQLTRRQLRKKQQQLQKQARGQARSDEMQADGNKCQIWVPIEVVDKYPYAQRIQLDQRNKQQKIQICCAGYAPMRWRGNTICNPVCENCRNGRCIAPNECECFNNFAANDNGDCVFTCPLGCLNGRCFLDGTCQCHPGFKLDETRKFCRPICSRGCGINPRINCTEPEVCSCAKGYQLTDEGCQPTCDPDCGEGGECRELNECYCAPGYKLKDGVCQRECYQKCDNGICYSTNRCICKHGFTYHERSTQCVPNYSLHFDILIAGNRAAALCCSPAIVVNDSTTRPLVNHSSYLVVDETKFFVERKSSADEFAVVSVVRLVVVIGIHSFPSPFQVQCGCHFNEDKTQCIRGDDEKLGSMLENVLVVTNRSCCLEAVSFSRLHGLPPVAPRGFLEANTLRYTKMYKHWQFFAWSISLHIAIVSACVVKVPQLKTRVALVTMRKYPVDLNCTGNCSANPLVLRTVKENYTDMEEVCCTGYVRDTKTGDCQPKCADCKNGKCVRLDVCLCNSGYNNLKNATLCEPECSEPCINGKCIAPDVCSCNKGFNFINGSLTECETKCLVDCTNGRCDSQDKCTCNFGYERNETLGLCVPICEETCENGICKAPNECVCNSGYELRLGTLGKCDPVCKGGCTHGSCIAPNSCQCQLGYSNILGLACVPHCKEECVNAHCTAPNQCTCLEGYIYRNNSRSECEPTCPHGCENGFCNEPGRCECHEGYKQVEPHVCQPICKNECLNGYCSAPDTCTCNDGYVYRNGSSTECEPFCPSGCKNGNCVSPGVCSCLPGYQALLSYLCIPVCVHNCIHGACTAPNTCRCFNGYRPNPLNLYECEPVCNFDCGHGRCIAPGICECDAGYSKKWVTGRCEPHCPQKCINSICSAGGVCRCFEGFRLRKGSNAICDPICLPSCINSNCVEPDMCECWTGYEETRHRNLCIAHCRPFCENGKCVAPNKCQCADGYRVTNSSEPHRCQAICKDTCINAECLRPEECVCLDGYNFLNGSQTECAPSCEQNCGHGKCIAPNACSCDLGYRLNLSNDTELPVCVAYCNEWNCLEGKCDVNGICQCSKGMTYSQQRGACVSQTGSMEEHIVMSGVSVSRWTIGVTSVLLVASCALALVLIYREFARRRFREKHGVRLIENPSFGVVMPGAGEEDGLNEQEEES
ncbi:fibrillin-2 [Eurosta solidaginis]|uniref:fibrillin-2 n=1 Tax=Eurosta solidaginis TaxID=178769 RepID=UPI003530CCB4